MLDVLAIQRKYLDSWRSSTTTCHDSKKTVGDHLSRDGKMVLLAGLRALGWPMERVEAALEFYSL